MAIRDFQLIVTRVPMSSDGDLIVRTYTVRAASLREAGYRVTVESVVPCMDNVVNWSVAELEEDTAHYFPSPSNS